MKIIKNKIKRLVSLVSRSFFIIKNNGFLFFIKKVWSFLSNRRNYVRLYHKRQHNFVSNLFWIVRKPHIVLEIMMRLKLDKNVIDNFLIDLKNYLNCNWIKRFLLCQNFRCNNKTRKTAILIADFSLPTFDKDSGSFRMFALLKIFKELRYSVFFYPENKTFVKNQDFYTKKIEEKGIKIIKKDFIDFLKKNGASLSFVILSRPDPAYNLLPIIRFYCINAKIFYDTVDLHWVRMKKGADLTKNDKLLIESDEMKKKELSNSFSSDVAIVITEEEAEILKKELPEVVTEVIPNIHEIVKKSNPFEKRKDIMFIGGFLHKPNIDAVKYFVDKIFPLILKELPDIKFFIVGSEPPEEVLRMVNNNVVVTGYVPEEEIDKYFLESKVFVSPLRYGAGMKGKIGQSMSYGLPVVTTSIGAEGLRLTNGENCFISDEVEEFAKDVVKIYKDKDIWNNVSKKSISHLENNFSKEVVKRKINKIFQ